jgi:cephalosporin hydroxylase
MSWRDLEGWFNFEAEYDRAVKQARPGDTLVEVGIFMGRSLAYLSRRAIDSGNELTIVGVDSFGQVDNHRQRFIAETERHAREEIDACQIMPIPSIEAAKRFPDRSLAFVWLDADHTYEGVCADIRAWRPKLRIGGVLAGHDYADHQPGVIKAVDELIENFAVCGVGTDCWWSVVTK